MRRSFRVGAEPFFLPLTLPPFTSPLQAVPHRVYSAFIVIIHRNNQKKRIFIPDPMMQCVPYDEKGSHFPTLSLVKELINESIGHSSS